MSPFSTSRHQHPEADDEQGKLWQGGGTSDSGGARQPQPERKIKVQARHDSLVRLMEELISCVMGHLIGGLSGCDMQVAEAMSCSILTPDGIVGLNTETRVYRQK